ncbi:MAG: DivIVA domain-containing protein [Flammeovirgaceae bacterium]|nr:DivIVA domain-containing protein [Flammeovirgaceae bacterium]
MESEELEFPTQLFGGYAKKAVRKWLREVFYKIQSLSLKNEELQRQNALLAQQIARYQELEHTLLQHIEELKKEKELIRLEKEKALEEHAKIARIKIIEAEAEAKRILDKAKKNAEDILSEAHKNSQEKIERMRHDLKTLEYNYNVVESHAEKFIDSVLELIEKVLKEIQNLAVIKKIAMTRDKINKTNRLLNETSLRKAKQFTEKNANDEKTKESLLLDSERKSVTFAHLPEELLEERHSENGEDGNPSTEGSFFDFQ